MAAGASLTTITDSVNPAYKARVAAAGSLSTSLRDPVTGDWGRVDAGAQRVGGTVTTVPGIPAAPWAASSAKSGMASPTLTVPAGKRLVIETFSMYVDVTTGNAATFALEYTASGQKQQVMIQSQKLTNGGIDQYLATQNVRLYADAGTPIRLVTSSFGTLTSYLTISGYRV